MPCSPAPSRPPAQRALRPGCRAPGAPARTGRPAAAPNSSGSSAPSATCTPPSRSVRKRHRGDADVHPQREVRGRADLAGDSPLGEQRDHGRVLRRPDPVPHPRGVQRLHARAHAGRPEELATVRHPGQPGVPRDPERRLEVLGAPAALVVGQPEADHAPARVLRSESSQGARLQRVLGPVRPDHHPDPDPAGRAGVGRRVQHQVDERGQPAEPVRVPAGIDLDLQPSGPVGLLVGGHLVQEPADVGLALQHRARRVVQPLEPEPALLVGAVHPHRLVRGQRVGQTHAVLAGEVDQGGAAHGAGEVQVQVGLGQRPEVAAQSPASASSRWIRPTPSTRSSSPERVRQPEVAGRPERLAGHDRDLGLVQDQRGQLGGGLRPPAAQLAAEQPPDGREAVERALRDRARRRRRSR